MYVLSVIFDSDLFLLFSPCRTLKIHGEDSGYLCLLSTFIMNFMMSSGEKYVESGSCVNNYLNSLMLINIQLHSFDLDYL